MKLFKSNNFLQFKHILKYCLFENSKDFIPFFKIEKRNKAYMCLTNHVILILSIFNPI